MQRLLLLIAGALTLAGCGSTTTREGRVTTHVVHQERTLRQELAPGGQIVALETRTVSSDDTVADSDESAVRTFQPPDLPGIAGGIADLARNPIIQAAAGTFPWGETVLGLIGSVSAAVATHQMVRKNQLADQNDAIQAQRDDVIKSVEAAKTALTDTEWAKVRDAMAAVQSPATKAAVAQVTT